MARLGRGEAVGRHLLEEHIGALIGERQAHAAAAPGAQQAPQQTPQRIDERKQLRPQDVAFAHVDDAVARLRIEAEQDLLSPCLGSQGGAATAVGRRQMGREDVGDQQVLRRQRGGDAIDQEVAIGGVVELLELAATAFGEVPAGWHLSVRPRLDYAVGQHPVPRRGERKEAALGRDAVALGGDADNLLSHCSPPVPEVAQGGGRRR
jgi:hypothetical protein